ncbi:hypothetical protein [Novosphingobium sp. Fuku2-ISO-50]|uniref:hypothetical protein n=1 Tax=Novosphingobium sp. Fuku2-ISO-50 TaxID=1739114 RepID=UPI003510A3AA
MGTLTVQLKNLEANGSGTLVRLVIGNPTSANITDLKLSGAWGALDKNGTINTADEHDFSTSISNGVPSSSWKVVSFNIDGGKPTDIGYIKIKYGSIQQIRLFGNN